MMKMAGRLSAVVACSRTRLLGAALCAVLAFFPAFSGAAEGSGAAKTAHKYTGAKKCKTCHGKELIGDQYAEWQKGEHAKAYETLKGEEAIELAKKKGITGPPHEAEECLKCHVTAYGAPASAFAKKPLKATDGVQCESCHGPGKDYQKKKVMSDRKKATAKGMWDPGEDATICTACHNDESPTWDPAKGFDHEEAKKNVSHPIPEDVKGKYLEIVAKRKAERGESDDEEEEEEEDE
jgi:hypothetical protein